VKYMDHMFYNAISFNQNIANWNIENVEKHTDFAKASPLEDRYNPFFKKSLNPIISLSDSDFVIVFVHAQWHDLGASAKDMQGNDISDKIVVTSDVNINQIGLYHISYNVTDATGKVAREVVRTVKVIAPYAHTPTQEDSDGDYIPDEIETLIGLDPSRASSTLNGALEGLQTQGEHGDTFFGQQWHLNSLGTIVNDSGVSTILGNDLDLLSVYQTYMGYNHGTPIIIQVVDTGVDAKHEDLIDNMDMHRSYNAAVVGDPSSISGHPHGTMVAGVIAARAFNGIGVRGVAPFAHIAASNWLDNQTDEALGYAWLTGEGANEITISSNSWGSYSSSSTLYEDLMEEGSKTLRDGKGRIYVFAAGNDRGTYGDGNANLCYNLSNQYPIVVAALKNDNTHANYSTPGSNVWVSAYSGNFYSDSPTIGTTTITGIASHTWKGDTKNNYTYAMNGTSAAAPMVSGVIGLVLEACPTLTWRDVKYLSAIQAKQIDKGNTSWVSNAAGIHHSTDYGFGLINAKGMIKSCTTDYTLLAKEKSAEVEQNLSMDIPDNNTATSTTINMPTDLTMEWVELTVDTTSSYSSDYRVTLTSPSGTSTVLMTQATQMEGKWMHYFRLSTAAMLDESSQGEWTITFTDKGSKDSGALTYIKLKVYGH